MLNNEKKIRFYIFFCGKDKRVDTVPWDSYIYLCIGNARAKKNRIKNATEEDRCNFLHLSLFVSTDGFAVCASFAIVVASTTGSRYNYLYVFYLRTDASHFRHKSH